MVKLKNIVIDNDTAKCDIFPEDSIKNGSLEINFANNSASVVLPDGYEWCLSHVGHAKKYLTNLHEKGVKYQNEKIIMWY